jgi:hypothetical protein
LREVKPLALVLNPKPGVTERYLGLQAHVDTNPQTEQQVLVAFAQSFSTRAFGLRSIATQRRTLPS